MADDGVWEESDNDELRQAEREQRAMRQKLLKESFREGVLEGKQRALQEDFDAGYRIGKQIGLRKGRIIGVQRTITAFVESLRVSNQLLSDNLLADLQKRFASELSDTVNEIADVSQTNKEISDSLNQPPCEESNKTTVAISENEDISLALEKVAMLEASTAEEGFQQGLAVGFQLGEEETRKLGIQKAEEIGSLASYFVGFAEVIEEVHRLHSEALVPAVAVSEARKLRALYAEFVEHDLFNERQDELLTIMRGRVRKCIALCKLKLALMPTEPTSTSTSDATDSGVQARRLTTASLSW